MTAENGLLGQEHRAGICLYPSDGLALLSDSIEDDFLGRLTPHSLERVCNANVDVIVPLKCPAPSELMFSVPLNPFASMFHCPTGSAIEFLLSS
jgi:hypothetical protein